MGEVHHIQTREQCCALIAGALAQGKCAVVNILAVFVADKDEALSVFREACGARLAIGGGFDLMEVVDDAGVQAWGYDVNTIGGSYLYGVSRNDVLLHFADMGTKQ